MKKMMIVASMAIGLILVGCNNSESNVDIETVENEIIVENENNEERNINIVVATDLHFISPQLTDYGASFMATIENGDGKVMRYTDELTDAFFGEVIEMQPDALILSGDTTFNGAKQSHIDLASKIKKVEESGVPVLVMSGNHDLGLYRSARFIGDTFEDVPSIRADEFYQIYDVSTYEDAVRKDSGSYSYVYEVEPSLWVLMVDVNGVDKANSISKKTYEWIEEALAYAYDNNIDVLAVSHQNVLVHNDMITSGFVISNVEELNELYKKYNVIANLSGHIHMQNIKTDNDVTEIVSSALSIQPNQYGVINIVGDEFEYNVKKTDVEAWAVANNSTDENLLNFSEYAKNFFVGAENNRTIEMLDASGASESEKNEMIEFFNSTNIDYFAGVLDSSLVNSDGMKLWEKYGEGTFVYPYMESMFRDNEGSDINIKLKIGE